MATAIPRSTHRDGQADRPFVPLSTTAVSALIDAVPDRYRALVLLAAGTGLRQGECFGVADEYLDLEKGLLRVQQQVILLTRREPFLSGTASPSRPSSDASATPPLQRPWTHTRTCGPTAKTGHAARSTPCSAPASSQPARPSSSRVWGQGKRTRRAVHPGTAAEFHRLDPGSAAVRRLRCKPGG